MNLSMWETIREYVAAEVKLALLRYDRKQPGRPWNIGPDTEMSAAEEQSTRMETEVRRLIDVEQKHTADSIRRASYGPPRLK